LIDNSFCLTHVVLISILQGIWVVKETITPRNILFVIGTLLSTITLLKNGGNEELENNPFMERVANYFVST
jgi:hypothetical protein